MKQLVYRDNGLQTTGSASEAAAAVGAAISRVSQAAAAGATLVAGKDILPGATLVRTGAGGAAYNDTLPTGTLMDAAFPSVAVGESFEMTIANHVAAIATIVAGATHTVVAGSLTAIPANSSAKFIFTRTAANTWTYEQI
jgi:hypothetical protein